MNDRQRKRLARGQRVDVYMDAAAEDFPLNSKGGSQAARLKELLAQVRELDVARTAGAGKRRQGTEGRAAARITLRKLLKNVSDTSNTIAIDHAEIRGLFESPSKIKNDQALVTTARAYADAAAAHAALFAEYGLTADFFNDIRAKADALENYTTLQVEALGDRMDTIASVEETLRELDAVVERLDTHITNKYREGSPRLTAWHSAQRIESAPRSKARDDDHAPEGNNNTPSADG